MIADQEAATTAAEQGGYAAGAGAASEAGAGMDAADGGSGAGDGALGVAAADRNPSGGGGGHGGGYGLEWASGRLVKSSLADVVGDPILGSGVPAWGLVVAGGGVVAYGGA